MSLPALLCLLTCTCYVQQRRATLRELTENGLPVVSVPPEAGSLAAVAVNSDRSWRVFVGRWVQQPDETFEAATKASRSRDSTLSGSVRGGGATDYTQAHAVGERRASHPLAGAPVYVFSEAPAAPQL